MMNTEFQTQKSPSRWLQRASLLMVAVALAACTQMPMVKRHKKPATTTRPPATATQPATRGLPSDQGGAVLQNFAGSCHQKDIDGFAEDADLRVQGGQVTALTWRAKAGRKGQCSFDLRDFNQVKNGPHIELASRSRGACKLMIYQEPRRVTLAHANCQSFCSPRSVADEAWPVMFNPQTGGCARLDR